MSEDEPRREQSAAEERATSARRGIAWRAATIFICGLLGSVPSCVPLSSLSFPCLFLCLRSLRQAWGEEERDVPLGLGFCGD